MTPTLKPSTITIITLLLLLQTSTQGGILDFEYTQYTQTLTDNDQHHPNLDFTPAQIPTQKLTFPQACNAIDVLNQDVVHETTPEAG